MTTEWTELNTLQDVAKAQADGLEIEVDTGPHWEEWKGTAWMNYMTYRARPRQPKMKKVRMLCWTDGETLFWNADHLPVPGEWTHISTQDIEIEIPEGV